MSVDIIQGGARAVLEGLPACSVHTCITSPPYYGLRQYGGGAQEIGAEKTPAAYVAHLVEVFRAVQRVLRDDGTCWIVIGSSFANGIIESDDYVMRDDLTDQERAYVYAELAKHFESQSEALSTVRQANASPEPTLPCLLHGPGCSSSELCGKDV